MLRFPSGTTLDNPLLLPFYSQILLPGYGGTMAEWTPQFLRRLAHRRQVVIFDYAGQGLSKVRWVARRLIGPPRTLLPLWSCRLRRCGPGLAAACGSYEYVYAGQKHSTLLAHGITPFLPHAHPKPHPRACLRS